MAVWRAFFSRKQPVTGTGAIQMVLWFWCVIWFIPLVRPDIALFQFSIYAEMGQLISETAWTVLMGILVVLPVLVDAFIRNYQLKIRIFICIAIVRSGVFAFVATMFFRASPTGIAAPNQALMALLALWVVWRLTDELYS